jgi:Glycosyltransferase
MRYWPVYGGGETVTVTLANEFVKRGHNVFVVYKHENFCTPMPYEVDNRVCAEKMYTIEHYTIDDVNRLHRFIIKHNIDVMINQWGDTSLCAKAKIGSNCKLITCCHSSVIRKACNNLVGRAKLIRRCLGEALSQKYFAWKQIKNHNFNYKLSDKYIFLSPFFVNDYISVSGIKDKAHKLGAISNPLTYEYTYDVSQYLSKQKKALFVGRILEYPKRLSYVLKIWKKIEDDTKFDDWSLTIVGDGPDMQATKELASSLALHKVFFEGFKNPRPYYEEASVFMMTSAFEGFGMTLVEAQQYATVPVVMDTYGSLHDIIVDGKNGIIIPDNDLDGCAEAMKKLMSEADYRERLAKDGLQSCKKFAISTICDKWINLFKEIKK